MTGIDFTLLRGSHSLPAVLRFATDRVRKEWEGTDLHPTLRIVVNEAVNFAFDTFDEDLTLTCLLRTIEEDAALYSFDPDHKPGVHCFGRAADFRTRNLPGGVATKIVDYLDDHFVYDPSRLYKHVALNEAADVPGSTANHIHCQVSDVTVKFIRSEEV